VFLSPLAIVKGMRREKERGGRREERQRERGERI
jgi:hypothetical protein